MERSRVRLQPPSIIGTIKTKPMTDSHAQLARHLIREPTVHFLVIAALVFLGYALLGGQDENVLELDAREIEARLFLAELSAGRELSEEQEQEVVNRYVEEQVLVAEALAMNLDNDARIHDILAQKMRHVLSADVIQPDAAELQEFYAANIDRYRRPPTVTVDELVFNTREPLDDSLLELLKQNTEPQVLLSEIDGSVSELAGATHLDLANIFSTEFADRVFAAEPNVWSGPFPSNRGQHWLRIVSRQAATTPGMEAIGERVRLDWIAREEEARLQLKIDELRQQYQIIISEGGSQE